MLNTKRNYYIIRVYCDDCLFRLCIINYKFITTLDSDFKKSYIHVKFKQYDLPMKIFLLAAVFLIGILFSAQQRMSEKKIEELKVLHTVPDSMTKM